MFALLAALAFLLKTIDVSLGHVDLIALGLFLLAVHLIWPLSPWQRP